MRKLSVWQRYQVYMALPARAGGSSGAGRNQNGGLRRWRWSSAQPMMNDYRGRINSLPIDARHDGRALSEAGA